MVLPCDYHMHTPLCLHATGEPSDYAAYAVKIGLNAIGFSDHSPMAKDGFDDWRMRLDQLDEYVGSVIKARKDHPSLIVKLGLEVDYIPGHEDWIKHLRSLHPWDYFIGSVHYVSDVWDLDNPKKLSEWKTRDAYDVWKIYFERLTKAAGSGLFETIAHADLPKKFNFVGCPSLSDQMRMLRAKSLPILTRRSGLPVVAVMQISAHSTKGPDPHCRSGDPTNQKLPAHHDIQPFRQ